MATVRVSHSFPTFRYVVMPFRWFFRSRRRVLTTLALLVAMILAPPLWWSVQLVGLPDIGEPFDVKAFQAFRIPDDQNAFVIYERAFAQYQPLKLPPGADRKTHDVRARWSKASPLARDWLEKNRAAMEVYRRGSERSDAQNVRAANDRFNTPGAQMDHLQFQQLAWLEASRLEDRGEMATAWAWYRVALRGTYHLGHRGRWSDRQLALNWQKETASRIDKWAADPKTTPEMLRRALDDVIACGALMPVEADTLRVDYLDLESRMKQRPWQGPGRSLTLMRLKSFRIGALALQLDDDWNNRIADAWEFWRREPERSNRVIRLVLAHWLAYYELPPDRRPPADLNTTGRFDFYAFGPEAPAKARALSPKALDRWLTSSADAPDLLHWIDHRRLILGERAGHRALVVTLASELYKRDHGAYPKTEEALIGPYLKELPDDGTGTGSMPMGESQ